MPQNGVNEGARGIPSLHAGLRIPPHATAKSSEDGCSPA